MSVTKNGWIILKICMRNPILIVKKTYFPILFTTVMIHISMKKISSEEIKQSIKRVKPNKSVGPDGLCIELYKHTSDVILPFLTELFNMIYDTGYFPVDWSTSIVVPLHKSGPTDNPHN